MVTQTQCQVDAHQLKAGRPPSLLPFDSLLLSYPVTSAWRRQIAEAHSLRYMEASRVLSAHDGVYTNANRTRDSALVRQQGFRVLAPHQEGVGAVYSDGDEAAGAMGGESTGRAPLNIGFIGHDFDEHPTAHMIEGVFVWQKRLARTNERTDVSAALERGRKGSSRDMPVNYRTTPTTAVECCR